jgi:hypothetical protein
MDSKQLIANGPQDNVVQNISTPVIHLFTFSSLTTIQLDRIIAEDLASSPPFPSPLVFRSASFPDKRLY